MKILDRLKKNCENDDSINDIGVPNVLFEEIRRTECFSEDLEEFRFLMRQKQGGMPSYREVSIYKSDFIDNGTILLGHKVVQINWLDELKDRLGEYGGVNNTNSCQHEFINVGFSTITMVCKLCDKEQL